MTPAPVSLRFRAVSMEFSAYFDAHTVEMRILSDTGQNIVIVCPRNSIFTVQKQIAEMREACPEIATWSEEYRIRLRRGAAPGVQPPSLAGPSTNPQE